MNSLTIAKKLEAEPAKLSQENNVRFLFPLDRKKLKKQYRRPHIKTVILDV